MTIDVGGKTLKGDLKKVRNSSLMVLFAHGSGSGRKSPRNRFVAEQMAAHGISVFLMDLLTEEEDSIDQMTREYRFDIPMLAERVIGVKNWVEKNPELNELSIGLFGSSTGAAAALIAAAKTPNDVKAVVSRGGRIDLASNYLSDVKAPTLLIVGEKDRQVLEMNRNEMRRIEATKKLEIVSGAGHLFGQPGALEAVAILSSDWFSKHQ